MKRIFLILTLAVVLLLSGCSDIKSKAQGRWQLDKVDGMSISDYSEQSGIDPSGLNISWTINGNKVTAQIGGVPLFSDEEITYTDNGFRFNSDTATAGAAITITDNTLSYYADVNGRKVEHVFVKS